VEALGEAEGEMLAARVAALVEFARYAPEVFENSSDIVLERLMRRVVHVPIVVRSSFFPLACSDPLSRTKRQKMKEKNGMKMQLTSLHLSGPKSVHSRC